MGAIATLLTHRLEQRSTSANPAQWLIDWVTGGAESAAGVHVSHDSALKFTPFWAAVRIISGTIGCLPFKVYRHLDAGGKREDPTHPAYRLLHDAPNEYMSALDFKETRQAHVLCYGNGYAEIQRDGGGRPVALWPLLPDKVTRRLGADGTPYYEVRLGSTGESALLPEENVLHVKGLGYDGYTGYDVVTYHKEALGYGIGVKEYAARFYGNGANPGGYLEHPSVLGEKAHKNLQESMEKKYGGLSNSHRLMILEEGLKFHETMIDPQRAQALETQKWSVDDCSRIFQIPPHKLASMEFSKYNNVEQLELDFVCTTLLYWFCKWEQETNRKLFLPRERGVLFSEILADGLLRGNTEARAQFYASGRQWGWLSINDIHRKENMNPIGPKGDVYLNPLNMVPVGTPLPKVDQKSSIREAHRQLLAGQWRRIITKQVKALEKPVKSEWWSGHRDYAYTVLADAVTAYGSVVGAAPETIKAILSRTVQRWIQPAITLDSDEALYLADDLIRAVGGTYADSEA